MNYPVKDWGKWYDAQPFGTKTAYGYHEACDLNLSSGGDSDLGQPLIAVADGIISSVHSHATNFGNHIHLEFKVNDKTYYAHYAHCKDVFVSQGQTVKQGDKIATLGKSGTQYAHLHFAIKNQPTGIDGIAKSKADLSKWEDPIKFIEANLGNVIISPPVSNIDYKAIFDKTGDLLPDRALKDDTFLDTSKLYKDNNIPYVTLAADSVNHYMSEYRKFRDIANTPTTTPPDAPQSGDNFEAVVDPPLPVEPDLPTYPATEFDIFDWLWRKISNLWKR